MNLVIALCISLMLATCVGDFSIFELELLGVVLSAALDVGVSSGVSGVSIEMGGYLLIDAVAEAIPFAAGMQDGGLRILVKGCQLHMAHENLCTFPFDRCPEDETLPEWK